MTDPISNERLARELWKKHGGTQHGPRTETLTMPEANFNAFVSDPLQSRHQSPAGVEPVGEASNGGFTMAAFEASKVPVGTKLYISPPKAVTITDDLLAALMEARDALNGAPNTVGLHHQIDAAISAALSSEAHNGREGE